MSPRKPSRHNGHMLADAQARAWLKQDLPAAVKTQLLLAVKGGRQQKRRCLGCGAQGVYVEVYVSYDTMRPVGDEGKGIRVYWLCEACHTQGLTPELEAKLQGLSSYRQ